MPVDPIWYATNGPFADQNEGAINALTMRNFASHMAQEGTSSDWFEFEYDTVTLDSTEWQSVGQAGVVWLKKTAPFTNTANWSYSPDPSNRDAYVYGDVDHQILTISQTGYLLVNSASVGTVVEPVVSVTDSVTVAPAPENTIPIDKGQTIVSGGASLSLTNTIALSFPPTDRALRFGVRFTPASGFAVASGSFNINATGVKVFVCSRPAASSV